MKMQTTAHTIKYALSMLGLFGLLAAGSAVAQADHSLLGVVNATRRQ